MLDSLKDIYVSLSRAVEKGDQLNLGIVIGQTICKLNEIINQADEWTSGDLRSSTCECVQCVALRRGSTNLRGDIQRDDAANGNQTEVAKDEHRYAYTVRKEGNGS